MLTVCVCAPMCTCRGLRSALGVPSLLLCGFQQPNSAVWQAPSPAEPSLWPCLSFTTQSSSFLLCSVIPFILTVGLQMTLSLCSQVDASQALPSIVFPKAFNILEQSDGNSLHYQFQCWAVMSCCQRLEHPYSITKERLQVRRSQTGLLLLLIAVSFPSILWMRILNPPFDSFSA